MSHQPMIDMILDDQPVPSERDRQISWLQFCFAVVADIPMENVSVVHNDSQEAVTVHLSCTCPDLHVMTFTHWCGSDDEYYTFMGPKGLVMMLPLEPQPVGL